MKFIKLFSILFIAINSPVKADLKESTIKELAKGEKLIFIRHAYAPGGGDPNNFDLNDCSTQRNLNSEGQNQSKKIGLFFKENKISIENISNNHIMCNKD